MSWNKSYVTYILITHTDAPSTDLTVPLALSMYFESLVWLAVGACLLFSPSVKSYLGNGRSDPNED